MPRLRLTRVVTGVWITAAVAAAVELLLAQLYARRLAAVRTYGELFSLVRTYWAVLVTVEFVAWAALVVAWLVLVVWAYQVRRGALLSTRPPRWLVAGSLVPGLHLYATGRLLTRLAPPATGGRYPPSGLAYLFWVLLAAYSLYAAAPLVDVFVPSHGAALSYFGFGEAIDETRRLAMVAAVGGRWVPARDLLGAALLGGVVATVVGYVRACDAPATGDPSG